VASIDAAGVGWGSCLWLDVAGAFCPGPAGCAGRRGEWGSGGRGDVGRGGLLFVCADRGDAPQLHQTDGCAVLGIGALALERSPGGSAASMDAVISPVRGSRPLSLLWPSSGRGRGGQAAPPRESAMPASAKPGWNPIPPGFVASWGRGIDPGGWRRAVPSVLSAVLSAVALAKAEGLPNAEALAKEGHKRRKGVEGEDEPCVASIDAAGGGLGDAVDWFQSALTGAAHLRRAFGGQARPGCTRPMAARYGGRSPRLGSLAGWGPRRLWTPISARSAGCALCAFWGYRPQV
jgi:hypothetical protein